MQHFKTEQFDESQPPTMGERTTTNDMSAEEFLQIFRVELTRKTRHLEGS